MAATKSSMHWINTQSVLTQTQIRSASPFVPPQPITQPLSHSLSHSVTQSLPQSLSHSLTPSVTQALSHSATQPLSHSPLCPYAHLPLPCAHLPAQVDLSSQPAWLRYEAKPRRPQGLDGIAVVLKPVPRPGTDRNNSTDAAAQIRCASASSCLCI